MQEVFKKIIEKLEDIPVLGTFPTEVLQDAIKVVEEVAKDYNNGWIPVEERFPENDNYILVSFDNFSGIDIARYEKDEDGGAFYPGDEEKSYVSFGLFVNAWQPLPESYQLKMEDK